MSSIYYDPVDDEEEGSADLNDVSDDEEYIPEGSGNYDIYEPDVEPIDNYMGKHEPDTYVEINRAEYQIKIHLSESTIRGEELLETATDKVKSILQSMIPDIKEVQIVFRNWLNITDLQIDLTNANIKGDTIIADLTVAPFQEPNRLVDEFDQYMEQDFDGECFITEIFKSSRITFSFYSVIVMIIYFRCVN